MNIFPGVHEILNNDPKDLGLQLIVNFLKHASIKHLWSAESQTFYI